MSSQFQIPAPYSYLSLSSNANQDSQVIKVGPALLRSLVVLNTVAALRYIKVYDTITGASPTSSDTPVLRIAIPANASTGGGFAFPMPSEGILFNHTLSFRLTTGPTDGDTGQCATNDVLVNAAYQ